MQLRDTDEASHGETLLGFHGANDSAGPLSFEHGREHSTPPADELEREHYWEVGGSD